MQGVTLVGDRGMIRTDQKAAAQKAEFHFVTALTKPQIQKLLADKVLQLELFEEKVHEVLGEDGRRFVLRRNPVRQAGTPAGTGAETTGAGSGPQESQHLPGRAPARQSGHPAPTLGRPAGEFEGAGLAETDRQANNGWFSPCDAPALQAAAQLDGCYVVETDLKAPQADAQTIHDRYKDLALVERDFRTLKTGHLEFRPWFVCTEDNTQAHALTSMLALKVRRHLERAWWSLEVTVEEGLRELEKLCVMELVHPESGKVVARQVPEPSARQKQLLDALKLALPAHGAGSQSDRRHAQENQPGAQNP